jgi:hypothetical protein
MEAGFREIDSPPIVAVARLEAMNAIEPGSARVRTIGVLVGQRSRMATGIPFLTIHHAGMTANACVEIDNEAEAFFAALLGK